MGFPEHVSNEVMVKCSRHCCLCGEYKGLFLQLHHIVPRAQGGDDSADNCIPLCPNCHAEVENYNPKHALVRKYTSTELKAHRDKCYAKYALKNESFDDEVKKAEGSMYSEKYSPTKVRWGYISQDELCPLSAGMVVLVGGCSGSGKSAYVQKVVMHNLNYGKKVLYFCLKDSPDLILNSIVAQASMLKVAQINQGQLTAEDWNRIAEGLSHVREDDLKILSWSDISSNDDIVSLVERSGAEIVVVDDFGGLLLNDNTSVISYMYRLKQAAIRSNAVVFVLHNMEVTRRQDKRPMLRDFPSDGYYRLCDMVHFLFRPAQHDYYYDDEKHLLEVIVPKNVGNKMGSIQMVIFDEMALVRPFEHTLTAPDKDEVGSISNAIKM